MFEIGQQVVCVNDTNWDVGYGDEVKPIAGLVYTIRGFQDYDRPRLLLEEIRNPERMYYSTGVVEPGFLLFRFRPIRKTDISIFTAMLTKAPEKEVA